MALPRPASPNALIADLRAFLRERRPHQLWAAALAVVIPAVIILAFALESRKAATPGPQLVYAKSWTLNRTDAEIVADQKTAQAEKEAMAKERQRQFKKLADQLGIK